MSNPALATDALTQSFEKRQREIEIAKAYVKRTQELFDAFGSAELKTSHARFPELLNALESSDVRLVVLGEFSRGKSFLLNSLLGIKVLPTATQTTTAINTFLKSLPKGETSRHILVHWQDKKRPAKRVEWIDNDALQRWGTELEKTNADLRKEVDCIELFLSHPLLDKGLVLVDTPGLQTIVKHHEAITRKAIAEAHIALFVQSADQLGGNQTEWDFMESTLKSNFQKFITVINKWDLVLDPEDDDAQNRSEEENVRHSLEIVKNNFSSVLKNGSNYETEFTVLTDEDHLFGVSAKWVQSKHADERERSGIDRLTARIVSMVASGEAMQQIVLKPLQQLSAVQAQLVGRIEAQLEEINSKDSLESRRRDLKDQDSKIKQLQADAKYETTVSSTDHDRLAAVTSDEVRKELIQPLSQLKLKVQDNVTESYVRKILDQAFNNGGTPQIALPPDLDKELKRVQEQVGKNWEVQKAAMKEKLSDLRAGYLEKMQKHANGFDVKLGSQTIEIPDLAVNLEFDFSALQEHQKMVTVLELALGDVERIKCEIENQLTRCRLTEQQAMEVRVKAQQEADRLEKKVREARQKQKELEINIVNVAAKKLRNKTIEQLDQAIQALDTYAKETVKATFAEQAKLLKAAIDEKLLEPLNAEIAQKQAIQDVIAKGEAAVQAERIRLEQGLKDIQDVHRMTLKRLQAA
jgi:GTPase SAR1 family protein